MIKEKVMEKQEVKTDEAKTKTESSKTTIHSAEIAMICSGVFALIFAIVEGALSHFSAMYALLFIFFATISVYYFAKFLKSKARGWLIASILEMLGSLCVLAAYIIALV